MTPPRSPRSRRHWQWALFVTTLLLTLLDYSLLRSIDAVMTTTVPGYISNKSLALPAVIFFFIAYFLNYRGIVHGLKRIVPYVVYGTSIFFPLIFVTSIIHFFLGMDPDLEQFYRLDYCPDKTAETICGAALAHMVFCSVMRTLPLLIVIPAAFYGLLKINFLGVATPHGSAE